MDGVGRLGEYGEQENEASFTEETWRSGVRR